MGLLVVQIRALWQPGTQPVGFLSIAEPPRLPLWRRCSLTSHHTLKDPVIITGLCLLTTYRKVIAMLSASMCVLSHVSCVWLFVIPRSLPGSSVHGILQARILEWVASSRGSSESSTSPALAGKFFTTEPQGKPKVLIRGIKNPCHLQPILT